MEIRIKKTIWLAPLLVVFLTQYIPAQTINLTQNTVINYRGSAGYEQWHFPKEGLLGQPDFLPSAHFEVDFVLQPPSPFELRFNPEIRWKIVENVKNDWYRDFILDRIFIKDLYFNYFNSWFEFRLGYQMYSWKTVESSSNADFINQTDLEFDLLKPEKFGEPSLRLRFIYEYFGEHVLELFYLAHFTPTHLPTLGNRFDFLNSEDNNTQFIIENNPDSHFYESPNERWRPQFAVRYSAAILEGLETSLFYFNGYNRFPNVKLSNPVKGIWKHEYRLVHKGGLTFQGVVANWLIKGEFTGTDYIEIFKKRVPGKLPGQFKIIEMDPYLSYTLGFEYTFYSLFIENHDVGSIFEILGDTDSGKDPQELDGFRPFQNNIFGGARYIFNTVTDRSVLAGLFYDYREETIATTIEYEERFFNNFKLRGSILFGYTPNSDLLKIFERNLRFALKVVYHW